jgi:hypothetical protein
VWILWIAARLLDRHFRPKPSEIKGFVWTPLWKSLWKSEPRKIEKNTRKTALLKGLRFGDPRKSLQMLMLLFLCTLALLGFCTETVLLQPYGICTGLQQGVR